MHFLKTSTLLLLSACLAQVIAGGGDRGQNGGDGNNSVDPFGEQRNQGGNDGGRNDITGQNQDGENNGRGDRAGDDRQRNQDQQAADAVDCDEGDDQDGGPSNNRGGPRGDNGNRDGDQEGDRSNQANDPAQAPVSMHTVTVTQQAVASPLTVTVTHQANAAALTVMTVTVTAPCTSNTAAGPPNAIATSVIAAPDADAPRKFITNDIKPGLTSLPVAVASALGADPNAVSVSGAAPSATSAATTAAAVAPSSAAPPAASAPAPVGPGAPAVAGTKFTTSGDIVVGRSSISVANVPAPSAA